MERCWMCNKPGSEDNPLVKRQVSDSSRTSYEGEKEHKYHCVDKSGLGPSKRRRKSRYPAERVGFTRSR